ncbi:MAG: methyltransferase domain-containing protein [Solirubrobacterales bacterium]
MREQLLDLLACPLCGGGLRFEDADPNGSSPVSIGDSGTNVENGRLACACGADYPLSAGIPRIVSGADADRSSSQRRGAGPPLDPRVAATLRSYSNWWDHVQKDVSHQLDNAAILRARTGLEPEDVTGKVVLDAGSGNGRIAGVLCDWGAAAVVGLDLGHGVDRARELLGDRPNLHLVQGSIMNPPFPPESFDIVISLGVLHHTPDTRAAFNQVASLVKQGGQCAIYLYKRDEYRSGESEFYAGMKQAGGALYHEPMRRLVVNLPHRAILAWSRLMTYKRSLLERMARRRPLRALTHLLEFVLPYDIHKPLESRAFNVVRNYDHYSTRYLTRHTRQEVIEWFQDQGFDDIHVLPYPTSVRGVKVATLHDPVTLTLWRERAIDAIESRGVERGPSGPAR